MGETVPTLESVMNDLDRLRLVARSIYVTHPTRAEPGEDVWELEDYLSAIDRLARELRMALGLPPCTPTRFEAEKRARNVIAVSLYFRGRLDLRTRRVGV